MLNRVSICLDTERRTPPASAVAHASHTCYTRPKQTSNSKILFREMLLLNNLKLVSSTCLSRINPRESTTSRCLLLSFCQFRFLPLTAPHLRSTPFDRGSRNAGGSHNLLKRAEFALNSCRIPWTPPARRLRKSVPRKNVPFLCLSKRTLTQSPAPIIDRVTDKGLLWGFPALEVLPTGLMRGLADASRTCDKNGLCV